MRTNRLLILPAVLATVLFLAGWADNGERIRRESGRIQSLHARFIQKKQMKILARPLVSRGQFYFQAPASIRWEYTDPVKSVTILHQGTLRRYQVSDGRLREAPGGSVPVMETVLQEIGSWLKGQFDQSPHFRATWGKSPENRIILIPREPSLGRLIQRIELTPSVRPGVLKSMLIVEDEGATTHFEFPEVQVNEPVPESVFQEIR